MRTVAPGRQTQMRSVSSITRLLVALLGYSCFHLGTLPPWIRQQLSDVVDMGNWCGCSITSLYVEAPCIIESQLSDMQRGI